jgi:8-oxo-dGTP pyrophosphatase MutT (NUDIX family)
MNTEAFIHALDAHTSHDFEEEKHRGEMLRFVASHRDNWWKRATVEGHVTGSAWILNRARTRALLLHHVKLDLWVQPGGHLDDSDASPQTGAMREAREETGIADLEFAGESLFDVDIHAIPARAARSAHTAIEPAHLHYDVRYLIIAADERVTISEESLGAKWMLLEDLALPSMERSIARMAEKSLGTRNAKQ